MLRPTARGLGLLVLALAAYVAGRVVGTYELYLTAIVLVVLLLVSGGMVLLSGSRLTPSRALLPERPVAGDRATDLIRLSNTSRLPTVALNLVEPLADVTGQDLSVDFGPLAPRSSRTRIETLRHVRRGVYVLPPVCLTLSDPLGLVRAKRRVGEEERLVVLPRIAALRSCVFFGQRDPGEGRKVRSGQGSIEFRGVRPHQPGEPLNRIHWKSTAKSGTLMLRETDDTALTGVAVVVDGQGESVSGRPPHNTFEVSVAAAGSIGDYILREGFGLDLHLHEAQPRSFRFGGTQPDRGHLLEALATARADAHGSLRDFLQRSQERLARGRALVVVSPIMDRGLALMLRRLREKGLPVYLVHVDGLSFAASNDDAAVVQRAAAGLGAGEMTERALLLNLQAAGVPSVSLRWGDDLEDALSYEPVRRSAGFGSPAGGSDR